MLVLYIRKGCPYCHDVEDALREFGLGWQVRDIAHTEVAADLVKRGGKKQVPYLIDTTTGVEMYESADIIEHLRKLTSSS
jgi:glutaredoxin